MCRILFAAVSAILILVTVGSLSPAFADRYCLQGRRWGNPGNCQFATLEQCRVAASGTHASCGLNPRYAFGRSRQGRQ